MAVSSIGRLFFYSNIRRNLRPETAAIQAFTETRDCGGRTLQQHFAKQELRETKLTDSQDK